MGLMAVIPLEEVPFELYNAYTGSAGYSVSSASSEVNTRGMALIMELQIQIMILQMTAAIGGSSLEIQEEIQELTERIMEIHNGMMAASVEGWNQIQSIYEETPLDEFQLDSEYSAFEQAFNNTIADLCPVRTGYLRSTCECFRVSNTIICWAGAEYAQYVEYGTSKMSAQPFFEPAIEAGIRAMTPYMRSHTQQTQINASTRGRQGVSSVSSAAAVESDDLAEALDGLAGFIMMLVGALIAALFEVVLELFLDISINYSMYIL